MSALLFVAFVLGASSAQAANFFYLVRQWPFSPCPGGGSNCLFKPSRESFTVHGLWTNFDTGRYPQFCDRGAHFDAAKLAPLRQQLDAVWPRYYGPNEAFWAHEYEKHGSCAEDVFPTELDYFNSTLRLHLSHNLESALAEGGVVPSAHARYSSAQMVTAIKHGIGSEPLVHCSGGKLTEIWMCVNEKLEFEDCDNACPNAGCHNFDCARPMLYPAGRSPCDGSLRSRASWSCAKESAQKLLSGLKSLSSGTRAHLRGAQTALA